MMTNQEKADEALARYFEDRGWGHAAACARKGFERGSNIWAGIFLSLTEDLTKPRVDPLVLKAEEIYANECEKVGMKHLAFNVRLGQHRDSYVIKAVVQALKEGKK